MRVELFIVIVLISSCSIEFEIPEGQVGVVCNKITGKPNKKVLRGGVHSISPINEVQLFNVNQKQIDLSFDFMFDDASKGTIEFSIKYTPKADSLHNIIKEYKTTNISIVTEVEIKSNVRDLLMEMSPNVKSESNLFKDIENFLSNKCVVNDFIEFEEFLPVRIIYPDSSSFDH